MNESNNEFHNEEEEELKEGEVKLPEDSPNEEIELDEIIESKEEFKNLPVDEMSEKNPEIYNLDITGEPIQERTEREGLEGEIPEGKPLEEQMREFHRNLIEASLYAAARPLTIEEISNKLELPKKEVEELINEVAFDYLDRSTALVIAQIGDRYQMQIRPEYTEKVSKFAKGGAIAERYLRTLTIIALKQPILKSTVVKLRGTGAYEHVKYLIDNGFLNAVKKGRSHELTTTDKYADMFGLPKDKFQLKQAMITQLGIEESSIEEQSSEVDEDTTEEQLIEPEDTSITESLNEDIEGLTQGNQIEIEDEKEEE